MVPNSWKRGLVSDLADTVMGYAFKSNDFVKKGIPLIRMGNLYQNQFQLDRNPIYLPDEFTTEYKRFLLRSGDLVMSMTGTMGKRDYGFAVEIPENTQDCLLNQRVLKIEPRNSDAKGFVLNVLKSEIFLSKLYSLPGGTKQANLSATQIREISVLIPPLAEQQKIAKILSTWDKAISTTERLINNSTQQKKALMQQLLTGKKRLLDESGKRFEGEWEEVKLENVFKLSSGDTKPKDVENEPTEEQKIPVFGGNNIMGYSANSNSEGDVILIGRVGEYCGVTRLIQEKCWITDNALFTKEFSDEFDRLFIVYLLQNFQLSRLRNKGGQPQISQKPIYTLKLKIPLIEEQQKIATVLTNADKEIELLKQQLADLQQEKKALMQVLLTGKKRVVVDS